MNIKHFKLLNAWKIQKPRIGYGAFGVDPTRFALVSPLTKGGILLHKLRARVHGLNFKTKEGLFQGPLLLVSGNPQFMQFRLLIQV